MKILLSLLANSAALMITAYLVPGFKVENIQTAVVAAIVLAVINTFIKPVLLLITAPLTILTLGLFIFIVNAIMLFIASAIVPGLTVEGWLPAILGALVLSVVSTILSMIVKDIGGKSK